MFIARNVGRKIVARNARIHERQRKKQGRLFPFTLGNVKISHARSRRFPAENLRKEIKGGGLHECAAASAALNTYHYDIVRTICG
jgi:hypothetical protein